MDIYVGNLPYAVTDRELNDLFGKHGTVTSARVIIDKYSGQSKGFGFVEMPDQKEAEAAVAAVNGMDFMGRSLRVNESQPKPRNNDREGGGGNGGGNGGGGGFRREKRW